MHVNIRRLSVAIGAVGALALIGAGVSSSWTDSGTATENVGVGTFGCQLSTLDPNAVISNGGHTLTVNMPAIQGSAAGSLSSAFTLTNVGTIPTAVTWAPAAKVGLTSAFTAIAAPAGATLAPMGTEAGNGGVSWTTLSDTDLGAAGSVSYTASCGEVPPPFHSPLSAVMGNANPQSVGYDGGSSNSAPMQVYLASITDGGSSAMLSFTMQIPFTTDNGGPIDCSWNRSAMGITGCSISGNQLTGAVLTVTYVAPASPYIKLGAGQTWTGSHLAGGALVYVGTANPSFGTVVTWGPITFTASNPAS